MIVDLSTDWLKELKPGAAAIQDIMRQSYSAKRHRIDLRMFTPDELNKLEAMALDKKGSGHKVLLQCIETFRLMLTDPSGHAVTDLRQLVMALVGHFEKTPHKWVFTVQGNKRVPYFVRAIDYHQRRVETGGRGEDKYTIVHPAFVKMQLMAAHGESSSVTWREDDIDGKKTVPKLISMKGMQTESPALMERYIAEVDLWRRVSSEPGRQFLATGTAHAITYSWYTADEVEMEREGERARVVVDKDGAIDEDETNRYNGRTGRPRRHNQSSGSMGNAEFWNKNKNLAKRKDDEDDDVTSNDEDVIALPIHPWVTIFDLSLHQYAQIHIADLEPYPFDTALHEKLVLPDDTAELIDALVVNADSVMEDIIKGKTGGTIVICTGEPGTGKTLTAEVMSEVAKRALYRVDCSQLGTSVDDIEKNLGIVLKRATRWGAVLLIDEADVYIRARGDDIQQNAIVGVFLRLLEYYHGILFMTSNRAVSIDDAILQRATAWVRYNVPTEDEKVRIWSILSANYEHPLGDELIEMLAKRWPLATGRNIKMMLKLARTIKLNNPEREGMELFEMAAKFLDVKDEKDEKPG